MSTPLSNDEVIDIIHHTSFLDYLRLVSSHQTKPSIYSIDKLRRVQGIDQEILCMIANVQDIFFIENEEDRVKVEKTKE